MRHKLARLHPTSAKSDDEIFRAKADAWNQKNITDRLFALNNDQIEKLSNKEFECVVNIGNRLYKDK